MKSPVAPRPSEWNGEVRSAALPAGIHCRSVTPRHLHRAPLSTLAIRMPRPPQGGAGEGGGIGAGPTNCSRRWRPRNANQAHPAAPCWREARLQFTIASGARSNGCNRASAASIFSNSAISHAIPFSIRSNRCCLLARCWRSSRRSPTVRSPRPCDRRLKHCWCFRRLPSLLGPATKTTRYPRL